MSKSPIKATAEPDYTEACEVCGQTPTVVLTTTVDGRTVKASTDMCGVCTWGTVECLDPANW